MTQRFLVIIGILLLVVLLGTSFLTGFLAGRTYFHPILSEGEPDFSLLQEVYSQVKHAFVEKVPHEKLVDGAVKGLLESLKDPYTRRLKKSDFESLQEETAGSFGGVGINLGMRNKKLTVIAPIKNTPAERAGVQAGDIIIKIDDLVTKDMSLDRAVKLIRGKEGTKVTLNLEREGVKKPIEVVLVREQIKLPTVKSKIIDDDIGYLNIHVFSGNAAEDLRTELQDLKSKGVKGIILDLRNNPGGLLDQAIAVSSVFIQSGPIVKVKSRSGRVETYEATNDADEETPLVVLVNKGSASASEIAAGAFQDRERAIVVGERTFGKASVQTVLNLSDGTGLVLTTANYLTPKGRSISKEGIKPDVVVKLGKKAKLLGPDDKQLNKGTEILRGLISKKLKKAS